MSATAPTNIDPTAGEGALLLLVEDEPSVGGLVRTYLERGGYRVVWVRSGEEALVELGRHAPRLVVLDVGLPGIDGFEVCRRIRAHSTVPVVMLTARDEEPDSSSERTTT
jgi:two-component system, OmpR family, response regulator